jgi:hypothetical protein
MSEATADIVGTIGAAFAATITSGSIDAAYLEVTNQAVIPLAVGDDNMTVTIASLPKGESWIRLDIEWAPGDANAIIDVGIVTAGTARPATPKHRIDDGDLPGWIELFGK